MGPGSALVFGFLRERTGAEVVKRLALCGILCVLVLVGVAAGGDRRRKLGDQSDGSRSYPVHRIPLLSEERDKIAPDDEPVLPFSTKQTCGACHSYEVVTGGWHFNAADANLPAEAHGRPGQPWIWADARTGVQIPISHRPWPGVFRPEQVGLSNKLFLKLFGGHTPGGGVGEVPSEVPQEIVRSMVSGYLEANCLACHDGDPGHDQGQYSGQLLRENFRWAAAATCSFASVKGSAKDMPDMYDPFMPEAPPDAKLVPPSISYEAGIFGDGGRVLLDIRREVPEQRCYFCHSELYVTGDHAEKWSLEEDVHLAAGMTCVDCHRNGIGHDIVRGYEGEQEVSGNVLAGRSSCKGCHLGGDGSDPGPTGGRLGAPKPGHAGIPPVHFEKLSCTACHSGPWPGERTYRTKTSMAHRLGVRGANKSPAALPHIAVPVFARSGDGKIAPHRLIWPAYWATVKDGQVEPIGFETVRNVVGSALAKLEVPVSGGWPGLGREDIAAALKALAGAVGGEVAYVAGGELMRLDESGVLTAEPGHPAGAPYLWPIGHNVRPAAQSLGVRYCTDCHATDAPFFFGEVAVDTPVKLEEKSSRRMAEFLGVDAGYAKAFAASFVFRPMLKVVSLCSCAVLCLVLLLYGLRALRCFVRVFSGQD